VLTRDAYLLPIPPDIAYLFVLSAVWTSGLALASPGTGILEMIALANLAAAVLTLALLPVHLWALGLLLAGVVFLACEAIRPTRWIFPSLAALFFSAGSIFLFEGRSGELAGVSIWLAVVVSVLTAAGFAFVIGKAVKNRRLPLSINPGGLIGQEGFARTPISMDGTVQVASELWSAQSDRPIAIGARVRVIARKGFVLTVEQES
jgi:membrane-bound serine protease (ClpP class)